jgi:hypothetical protein
MATTMADDIEQRAASGEEAELFHDIARKWTPLSKEIKGVRFRFGEASDGSPAVWITVLVTESIRRDVLEATTDRWPYINIETE